MKKLLLIFLFISGLFFGQQKTLFKAVSYNNLIELYNQKLNLKNEDLSANIERCKFIMEDARSKDDYSTELAFSIFLKGLTEASAAADKNAAFISIYKDPTSYSFYDSKNKFVARVDKLKMDEQIDIKGDKTETYISKYFYLLQE
ncbi:hypothetical protein [Chryseobacterium koreense]|uniref:Uncharacterized protein n=1 Tax=Chryseobacterium koreense CCUG 49689 TaxID=1304281 RepID=A0A0J7LMJ7_9FLAO|nr:hypothetical protein [Chryseobacterium koreense]KMQ70325.1 hypothetical protein ACM44_12975 [Chryseobacterium koreense CCUG 49689]MBB5334494.1 hypothetical protein [Chryseobacterium koreense]